MKLTFPHMGNAYIAVRVLLDELGLDYYMPRVGDRRSFEKGIANAPEFICLPFKTVLGNFIEGLDNGADVILFGGGRGQCRLSYYGDVEREILHDLGYKFQYIHLDLNHLSYDEVREKFGPFLGDTGHARIAKAVSFSVWTVFAVDGLYALAAKVRCRETEKGAADRVMSRFEHLVQNAHGFRVTRGAILEAKRALKKISTDPAARPLKVGVVGEIFISSEPFVNLDLERKLGALGVEVHETVSVSSWIREHFLHTVIPIRWKDKASDAAQAYFHTRDFGGHGIYTVGNAELFSREGYDGIIQIYPFTCMPEIIAQTSFSHIQERHGVPIMTLIVDEMTGEAGFITRLEAFTDMLLMRRESRENAAVISASAAAPH